MLKTALGFLISLLIFLLTLELFAMGFKEKVYFTRNGPYRIESWQKFLEDPQFSRMSAMLAQFKVSHPEIDELPSFNTSLLIEPDSIANNGEEKKHKLWLGNEFNPGADDVYVLKGAITGRVKFRARFSIDEHGFRRTPFTQNAPVKSNLVLLGCSYTFGFGVNQEETFAATVAREYPDVNLYNRGIPGSSPANLLQRIYQRKGKFLEGITKDGPSDFVFTFIDDHLRRTLGNSEYLARVKPAFETEMYFYLDDYGSLRHKESFSESFLHHLFFAYGKTHLAQAVNLEFPFVRDYHLELTAKIFSEIKTQLRRYLPKTRHFYVVAYPGNNAYFKRLIPFLEAEGIRYLDYSEVDFQKILNRHENLVVDYHPSALAYELYGKMLAAGLDELSCDRDVPCGSSGHGKSAPPAECGRACAGK